MAPALLVLADMKIADLMTPNIETIRGTDSCHDAAARMCRAKVRHLPVVDDTGRLVGVVTDRDLRHRLFSPPVFRAIGTVPVETLLKVPVAAIMSAPAATTNAHDELEAAARRMLEDKIGSLLVVDRGRCAPELEIIVSYS